MRSTSNPLKPVFVFFDKHKLTRRLLVLLLLFIALYICWMIGSAHDSKATAYKYVDVPLSDTEFDNNFSYLQITDLDRVAESASMKSMNFENSSEIVEIKEGGDYSLSGKLTGMIHIDAKEQNVHLFLNNLELVSKSGPAIYCENADKLIITLMPGTDNIVSDSGDYRAYDDLEACIYSECDMTINGTGSLTANGYYKDVIRSKDIVKILGGTFTLKCKRTAVHGNDGIYVNNGTFMISSEKNGFKTTKSGPEGRGSLIIGAAEMNIIAGQYAFVTTKANLYIYNCSINSRSIVDTFSVGGQKRIQRGCIDEY